MLPRCHGGNLWTGFKFHSRVAPLGSAPLCQTFCNFFKGNTPLSRHASVLHMI